MLIKRRPSWALSESEVTPESVYLNRRKFMAGTMASAAALTMPGHASQSMNSVGESSKKTRRALL